MITIKKIAAQLGVSPTTVSNVINGRTEKMSEETRRKVEIALVENHYVNDVRREDQCTDVKLITLDFYLHEKPEIITDPFCSALLDSAIKEASAYGRYVLSDSPGNDERILKKLLSRNVEGAIVLGYPPEKCEDLTKRSPKPIVFVDSGDGNYDNVGLQDFKGVYDITSYMISQGHRKIAYFYDSYGAQTTSGTGRYQGFRAAMERYGLSVSREDFYGLPVDKQLRREVMLQFARNLEKTVYTAAFFVYDLFANEAASVFSTQGISVPGDISITGFDDNVYARLSRPPLTTVRQDPREKGRVSVDLLMKRIYGEPVQIHSLHLPTELIVRESVRNIANNWK
ncbi:MAG: LacI family transcriptional regulator [Blautia sp.]|nr:LacI family transcriptional regulator [Blautia sp.]MDD7730538.1 LacI family DNA-binding transcriptional regulator [Clostridia bacterium]MDY5662966.1 LacI family DNA-binding transcriptional regulator [Blautia sp.]